MISRKKNWQYYSRASFKCILEEEQRVVWREFFSLRQVKRSKQSFHSVQPKPNVWADLAKIPHAFGTVLHTTYYTPDTRCLCVVLLQCRRRRSRRRGRGCCCGSDRQKPSFYDQPAEAIFANQNFQKKIRQIGSQMTKKTFLKKTHFKVRYTFCHFVTRIFF